MLRICVGECKCLAFAIAVANRSYPVTDSEILEDLDERGCKIDPRMRPRDFNEIEKHRYWNASVLEVDGDCNKGFMVGRGPRICAKVQCAVVFLR